jgi:hypothetical protein
MNVLLVHYCVSRELCCIFSCPSRLGYRVHNKNGRFLYPEEYSIYASHTYKDFFCMLRAYRRGNRNYKRVVVFNKRSARCPPDCSKTISKTSYIMNGIGVKAIECKSQIQYFSSALQKYITHTETIYT